MLSLISKSYSLSNATEEIISYSSSVIPLPKSIISVFVLSEIPNRIMFGMKVAVFLRIITM